MIETAEPMIFAENSDSSGGCPHPAIQYVVDCGYHTLDCVRCGKRWTLMDTGVDPSYSDDGLLNHSKPDHSYPEDECVDPRVMPLEVDK